VRLLFTGIIEEKGRLVSRAGSPGGVELSIKARRVLEGTRVGDSIAVNGVCLTVTGLGRDLFTARVMPETLRKTNLYRLPPGSPVNLERALALGDRLGGHLVSGHIDGVGRISRKRAEGIALVYTVQAPAPLLRYIIPKGSVAVDGVSLTVIDVEEGGFSFSLIPHTARETTLGELEVGAEVNLETDLIGKYVEKLLQPMASQEEAKERGITVEYLLQNGFL